MNTSELGTWSLSAVIYFRVPYLAHLFFRQRLRVCTSCCNAGELCILTTHCINVLALILATNSFLSSFNKFFFMLLLSKMPECNLIKVTHKYSLLRNVVLYKLPSTISNLLYDISLNTT